MQKQIQHRKALAGNQTHHLLASYSSIQRWTQQPSAYFLILKSFCNSCMSRFVVWVFLLLWTCGWSRSSFWWLYLPFIADTLCVCARFTTRHRETSEKTCHSCFPGRFHSHASITSFYLTGEHQEYFSNMAPPLLCRVLQQHNYNVFTFQLCGLYMIWWQQRECTLRFIPLLFCFAHHKNFNSLRRKNSNEEFRTFISFEKSLAFF